MSKLRLIDGDLLISIIKACRAGPPPNQDLVLSSNAEQTMENILQQKPSSQNYAKYNAELNKHATYLNKYKDSISQPPPTPPPSSIPQTPQTTVSETQNNIEFRDNVEDIVKRSGVRERKRMLTILDRLQSPESRLSWNKQFQLVEDGIPIQGTNLFDLLKTVSGERKKIRPTPGLAKFAHHLNLLNVSQDSAGTDNARRLLQSGQVGENLDPLVSRRLSKRKRVTTGNPLYKSKFTRWT